MGIYNEMISDAINVRTKHINKRLDEIEKKLDSIILQISDEEKWKEFLNQLNEGGRQNG